MILAAAVVFMVLLPEDDERDDFDILDSIRIFNEKGNSFSVTENDELGQNGHSIFRKDVPALVLKLTPDYALRA